LVSTSTHCSQVALHKTKLMLVELRHMKSKQQSWEQSMFKGTPSARQSKVLTSLWNQLFLTSHKLVSPRSIHRALGKTHQAAAWRHPAWSTSRHHNKQFLPTTFGCIEVSAVLQYIMRCCSIAHSMTLVQVPCCMEGSEHKQYVRRCYV